MTTLTIDKRDYDEIVDLINSKLNHFITEEKFSHPIVSDIKITYGVITVNMYDNDENGNMKWMDDPASDAIYQIPAMKQVQLFTE